jgi:hypothetical protein
MSFGGADVFLVLAHDEFVHQFESAPGFSESAARNYLRGRVERFEKDHEAVLSVAQRIGTVRSDAAYILHLLPRRFYDALNQILRSRRLDLTRILPLLVPLQHEIAATGESAECPMLYACEAGDATALVVGRGSGELWFSRTTLASWRDDAARVAVEVNRSLLFAKQQFGTVIDRLFLAGDCADAARGEVESKCGAGKHIIVGRGGPERWLDSVARLRARFPVNLVSGYLRRKRRQRFFRRALLAACWLGLALAGFDAWTREQDWQAEQVHLASLRAGEPELQLEFQRLSRRNDDVEQQRRVIERIVDDRLPPVPGRFLAYLAGLLPREVRLTQYSVKWDEAAGTWSFQVEGTIEADEETARSAIASVKRQLARGPLRVRLVETIAAAATIGTQAGPSLQRFSLEGGIFEN